MRDLYTFNWNRKIYVSTNKNELQYFANWICDTGFTPRVLIGGKTTWNIPDVEKAPAWIPVPIIEDGRVEYINT